MIKIKFLKGYNGDCSLITFLDNSNTTKNILIDGGTGSTYSRGRQVGDLKKEILNLIEKNQAIDLLIITHIDDDHIGGILKMFEDKKIDKSIVKKVWFNSGKLIAEHFKTSGDFKERDIELNIYKGLNTSVRQGIKLDDFLSSLGSWDYRIIQAGLNDQISNCKITVLSPNEKGLKELHKKWEREQPKSLETSSNQTDYKIPLKKIIENTDVFKEDKSIPNGSSIAFLLEIEGKKMLFMGDAYPSVVSSSLKNLGYSNQEKLKLDLFKISHHASKGNTDSDLLKLIDCDTYVTLTNSLRHGLPDKATYARIVKNSSYPNLIFNYNIIDKIFLQEDLDSGVFEASYLNRESIILD